MRWTWLLLAGCGRLGFAAHDDAARGDGEVGGDVAADGVVLDGSGESLCGSVMRFGDDFEDGTPQATWNPFNDGGFTVAETTGALEVAFGNVSADQYAGYTQSAAGFDINGACFTVELLTIPNAATTALAYVRLGATNRKVGFYAYSGLLAAAYKGDATDIVLGPVPFDPVAHRFLRMRQVGADFIVETNDSLDGPYDSFGALGVGVIDLASARIEIGAATDTMAVTAAAGQVRWGGVYVAGP